MSQAKRVGKNVLITVATQLVSWGLSFTVTLFLPRYLNDTGLGTLTLVASIAGILSVLVRLGTSTVLIKEIARDPSRLGSLIVAAMWLRLPLGLVALAGGWCIVKALGNSESLQFLVLLGVAGMIIMQTADTLTSALRGLEDFPRQNAIALTEKFLSSIAVITLVILRGPLWAFVMVGVFTSSFSLFLSVLAIQPHLRAANRPLILTLDPANVRFLFISGMPFLTGAVFTAIYGQCDPLILSKLSTGAAIGWYGLAMRLAGSMMFIPVAVCSTMLPLLTRVYQQDTQKFNTIARRLFNLMIISVLPCSALLIFGAGHIVSLLNYPASFRNSVPVIAISGFAVILWFLSQAAGTTLIASDRQHVFGRAAGIAAVFSVPLCAVCTYAAERFLSNGAVGAMISDVLTEAYLLVTYILALPKGIVTKEGISLFLRALLASLPIGFLFHLTRGNETLYLPIIGFLLYIPLCKVLGCFNQEDIQVIRGMFTKDSV